MRARPANARRAKRSKIPVIQRSIGRHHDHDAPVCVVFRKGIASPTAKLVPQVIAVQLPTHGRTRYRQHTAEVRLHEDTHGPSTHLARETSARRSDPPLPPKCPCASAGPHAPLLDRPTFRRAQCFEYVSLGHGSLANIVQGTVVGLPDDGIGGTDVLIAGQAEQVGEDGVRHARHAQRTGQDYGRFRAHPAPALV